MNRLTASKKLKVFFWLFLILLLIAGGITAVGYMKYKEFIRHSIPHSIKYTVPSGASLSYVAADLADKEVITEKWFFVLMTRFDRKDSMIKAGEYQIPAGSHPKDILAILVRGTEIQYSQSIIEGWTFKQMLASIRKNPNLVHDTKNMDTEEVMAFIGYKGLHPEGRFYPDTYKFPVGTKESQFLKRAYKTMEQHLEALWSNKSADAVVKTPYEALILASIIEKETAVDNERQTISGVFTRRLRKGMRLQTDPTVIYGMGDEYQGDIRYKDLRTDTPYNTYTRYGLPPTPIAMPGKEAIYAALHPESGKSLYFVAKGDGTHTFSATLKQHNRAVKKYLRQRRNNR
ncbi:MAG: endolytic transglycosylase MltG [Gammaproteobacteria bacterium]|nr:MAG: endolytic transglycosylase MltG [Gammaproteobacteria bacterium]